MKWEPDMKRYNPDWRAWCSDKDAQIIEEILKEAQKQKRDLDA